MLSLARPLARADFAGPSQEYLAELHEIAKTETVEANDFKERALWNTHKHKEALIGHQQPTTKCAWCERLCEVLREINVEHYRPKAAVTRWDGSPPLVSDEPPRQIRVSSGYWWLAFDWNNYSPACSSCNQTWKRNLFPVQEPRPTYKPGMEAHESALLIDPMSDFRTADHFRWDSQGYMHPESTRGEATIITCGLNRRPLVAARAKAAKNVLDTIELMRRARRRGASADRYLRDLRELCASESEFAGMSRWVVERKIKRTWADLVSATE